MKERPILFSAPMVRALLDGSKTQTRRVVKWHGLEPGLNLQFSGLSVERSGSNWVLSSPTRDSYAYRSVPMPCPYGQSGDRLYVRETFGEVYDFCDHPEMPGCPTERWHLGWKYRADGEVDRNDIEGAFTGWKPSIHMPRAASRIDLQITGVRVERLQDISEADADAEGCERLDSERDVHDWKLCPQCGGTGLYTSFGPNLGACPDTDCQKCDTYVKRYRHLWEAINGPGSWDANPWVWVVEFKVVRP